MRLSRQGKIVQAGDGFTWLIGTTVCLILIVCLISVAPSTIFHARSPHALQHVATALASDHVPISSANSSGLCFSALPERAMWHSFLPSGHEKTSTVDAVLAMVRVSPSQCAQRRPGSHSLSVPSGRRFRAAAGGLDAAGRVVPVQPKVALVRLWPFYARANLRSGNGRNSDN